MANGGSPPPGGQYPQQGGGYPPPQQGGGYPPPQGGYQGGGGGYGAGPVSPQGRPLASWGKRVGAALIDGLVVGIPATILMVLLGVGTFASEDLECTTDPVTGFTECTGGGGSFVTKILLSYVIVFALIIAYQIYFNGNERGQTVGKRAVNIQVRDEATGGPIGYGKAALRVLVGFALGFLCGIGQLVDILFPLWDPKRQTLHDKAANTLVVET